MQSRVEHHEQRHPLFVATQVVLAENQHSSCMATTPQLPSLAGMQGRACIDMCVRAKRCARKYVVTAVMHNGRACRLARGKCVG